MRIIFVIKLEIGRGKMALKRIVN